MSHSSDLADNLNHVPARTGSEHEPIRGLADQASTEQTLDRDHRIIGFGLAGNVLDGPERQAVGVSHQVEGVAFQRVAALGSALPAVLRNRPRRTGTWVGAALAGAAWRRVKPARTEAPQSEYRRIDRYRKDYQTAHRVALGHGGAEWWPDVGSDI
jgi:hypothetical protein